MEKFGRKVTRHRERAVRLTHESGDVLHGVEFYEFPVDMPPVITIPSLEHTLYRDVWAGRGWAIFGEDN